MPYPAPSTPKSRFHLAFFTFCALGMPFLGAADEKTLPSKITGVTVYADRAQVDRRVVATAGDAPSRLVLSGLPGWLDEGSIRVAVNPAEALQIVDVEVRRTYLARPGDETLRTAENALTALQDQMQVLQDERAILDAQVKQLEGMRVFAAEKLPRDATLREIKPAEYTGTAAAFAQSLRDLAAARREIDKKRRDLEPQREAQARAVESLRQKAGLEERAVVLTVKGKGAPAEITVSYQLPGATWEPVYELRSAGEGKAVTLKAFASVMQTTGEDWADVPLSLSTQRAGETLRIPELEALLVGSSRPLPRFDKKADTFSSARSSYGGKANAFFNILNQDQQVQEEFRQNQVRLEATATRVSSEFAKLTERGTTAHFPSQGPQIVRADGRPVRVPLSQTDMTGNLRLLAAPAASLNAVQVLDLTLAGKQPILPARVQLYRDGAFLGPTETEFTAPGETFSLYLGVDESLKISRTLDRRRSELRRLGNRTRTQAAFVLTVENLSEAPKSLALTERIPVSENDEVKVTAVKVSPDVKPDSRGMLRFDLAVGPRQIKEMRLEYTLDYPADLLDRKEKRADDVRPKSAEEGAEPALRSQIRMLEKAF